LIPLPQVKHIDEHFKDALDAIELQSTQLEHLPSLLETYKTTHISGDYDGSFVAPVDEGSGEPTIPVILSVDAMAIEPYSEKTKRMLLLKQVGVNLDSASLRILEEQAEIRRTFSFTT
jgi:hypothetical protein